MSVRCPSPPCPLDTYEMASAIAERGSPDDADARALAYFGFRSWSGLATVHARQIADALDRLPPPRDATGQRLVDLTRWFIGTSSWVSCVENGWPLSDVFGLAEWAPLQRRDVLGLMPALAISPKRGRRIEAITSSDATLRDLDGREITFRRPSLNAADLAEVLPWWQSPVLVNTSEAA